MISTDELVKFKKCERSDVRKWFCLIACAGFSAEGLHPASVNDFKFPLQELSHSFSRFKD